MILDRLIIENFGVYGGCQEADLSPAPGRPIILFGGMNGGGKTTLLDAIQLVFYGAKALLPHGHQSPGESPDLWSLSDVYRQQRQTVFHEPRTVAIGGSVPADE